MITFEIVLIEDNPADVVLLRKSLAENEVSCNLTTFHSGEEALKVLCPRDSLGQRPFVPDAILLDLNTPKSDGFEVLIKLRGTPHLASVPIAILTSSQQENDKARSIRLGAVRYIHKPTQLEEFLTTVGRSVKEMLHVTTRT